MELYELPDASRQAELSVAKKGGISLAKGATTLHSFAPDGSNVLIHQPSVGVIRRDLTGDVTSSVDSAPFLETSKNVQVLTFSPKGSYILTWERPIKVDSGAPPPNLKIWDGKTGVFLHGFHVKMIKKESWPYVKWTHDERTAFHAVTNEIHVYDGHAFTRDEVRYDGKIRCTGLASFSLPERDSQTIPAGTCLLTTFVPELKGKPARISLLRYPDHLGTGENPKSGFALVSKSLYQTEEVTTSWSPKGDAALILTHTSVDNSGESYYGSTNLQLLLAENAKGEGEALSVPLPGSGPVLDVSWMPNASKPSCFVVISGRMPAMASLHHGTTSEPLFLFGNAHRNTVIWSPHGRFLNLAGFGNLAGGMDFWDRNKNKKIPQFDSSTGADTGVTGNTASCAVGYGWSPDSRTFLVSTTSPRMNVDNGARLFRYDGVEVTSVPWDNSKYKPDRLLSAEFVPSADGVYEDRAQSPPPKKREGAGAPAAVTTPRAAAAPAPAATGHYVPPAARRAASGGTSLAERMRQEREGSTAGATKVSKTSSVVGMSAGGKKVPGAAPEGGKSKNALRRERQRQAKAKAEEEERLAKEAEAKAAEEKAKANAADPEKRAKKIKKTLKQIDDLKSKDPAGLNEDQRKKIGTESALREELAKLAL